MTKKRKYPPISIHPTLCVQLEVNWQQEYNNEFNCPDCQVGKMTRFAYQKRTTCKFRLGCNSCGKRIHLTNKIIGMGNRKNQPISHHPTLNGVLKINWDKEYKEEYNCPECNHGVLRYCHCNNKSVCKFRIYCESCQSKTLLNCRVANHIYNYLPTVECPNPLCTQIGHNRQKGWIYKDGEATDRCRCHFCGIRFKFNSTNAHSWVGSQSENKLSSFCFEDDVWNLQYFFDHPKGKSLNFTNIYPQWYRLKVKKYLHYLIKSRTYSPNYIQDQNYALKQLGEVIQQYQLQGKSDISRQVILSFLDACNTNQNGTINNKLRNIKQFLEWLELDVQYLIRNRDFLKENKSNADWLDKVTREAIKQNLSKIPAPIAHHYLVLEYTAARPGDLCQIAFDCLVEENGNWYIKFYQSKVERWHKILATREIRRVIEEQQKWIRQTFGSDYPYLFCHFRSFQETAYPDFANIRALPQPPKVKIAMNPMVRIIRMLIEKEDIRSANGQKPHFTGKIIRPSRLQEVRTKYGMEAARLYADHKSSSTTFRHYAPPTREQVASVDLPFQELLMNPDNKFLPWQSLPESLLKNPQAHELDLEIAPRLVVYGHCALNPKTPCPVNLFPKCYGCSSFRPSTGKLPLYERQYQGEQQRLTEAEASGAELAFEEAKATIEAMDKWLPELRRLANG